MLRGKQKHHPLQTKVGISAFYSALSDLSSGSEESVPVVKIYFYFHFSILLIQFR